LAGLEQSQEPEKVVPRGEGGRGKGDEDKGISVLLCTRSWLAGEVTEEEIQKENLANTSN